MNTLFSIRQFVNWLTPRNSIVRGGGVIFLCLMVFNGCQNDNVPDPSLSASNCGFEFGSVDLMTKKELIIDELDQLHLLKESGALRGEQDFFMRYCKDTTAAIHIKQLYEKELMQYKNMGLEDYLDDKENSGLLSYDLKNALLDLSNSFQAFISSSTTHTLASIIAFLDSQDAANTLSTTLCASEINIMNLYVQDLKLMVEYYLMQEQSLIGGSGSNVIRESGCDDILEKIKCGAFTFIVGVVIVIAGTALGIGIAIAVDEITITDPDGNTTTINDPTEQFGEVFGLVLGVWAVVEFSNDIYQYCCNSNDPECGEISNIHATVIDCNNFNFHSFGAGEDVTHWIWTGINTVTPSATTTVPYWNNQAISIDQAVKISVTTVCPNTANPTPLSESFFLQGDINTPPPPLNWAYNLTATTPVFVEKDVSVITGTSQQYQLVWTCSEGASITPNGPYAAKVTFYMTGNRSVTATVTNTCTGQQSTISATTFVQ